VIISKECISLKLIDFYSKIIDGTLITTIHDLIPIFLLVIKYIVRVLIICASIYIVYHQTDHGDALIFCYIVIMVGGVVD